MAAAAPKSAIFSPRWEWLSAIVLCVIVLSLRLVWPGDTQWINDEPLFLAKAAAMRHGGPLSGEGLRGTTGLTYGPMAIWMYAGLMRLSSGLIELVVLRTALFGLFIALGLFWLAAVSRRLRPLGIVTLLLSPYAWLYARHLWDNTWLIPLGTLGIAAYASFQQQQARWKLCLAVLLLTAAALIHPMVAPLIVAVAVHALRFHRSWLRAHFRTLLLLGVVVLVLAKPWLVSLFYQLLAGPPPPSPPSLLPAEPAQPFYTSLIFGLLGGRVLSAQGFVYFLGEPWFASERWGQLLVLFTFLSHILLWAGVLLAARNLHTRRKQHTQSPEGNRPMDIDYHLDWLFLVALLTQWLMLTVLRRNTHPHYYNGAWICYAYFLWKALSTFKSFTWMGRLQSLLGILLAGALAVLTAQLALHLHHDRGNRGLHIGTVLQNQLTVVNELAHYHPDSPLRIEVRNFQLFPHALPILRKLTGTLGDPAGNRTPLCVRYRDPEGPDATIIVVPSCP